MVPADFLSCRSSKLIKLLSPSGYLSNTASSSSSSGTADCIDGGPEWLIEAGPGQRINISLWDFGGGGGRPAAAAFRGGEAPSTRLSGCVKYATVTELSSADDDDEERVVCGVAGGGGDLQRAPAERVRHVHTSLGNAVKIRLHVVAGGPDQDASSTPRFLLHYRGFR